MRFDELQAPKMPKCKKPKSSSKFSDFIRNASLAEKTEVYTQVIKHVIDSQREIIEKAISKDQENENG